MAQRINYVGDAAGGWLVEPDFWPDGQSLDMYVQQEGKPVRGPDLNLVSQNAWVQLRDAINRIITSGWTKEGPLLASGTANTITAGESWCNLQGRAVHVGDPDHGGTASILLPAPPNSGSRTDLVFLEVWVQEVASTGSADQNGTGAGGSNVVVDRNLPKWGGADNQPYTQNWYWTTADFAVETARRFQVRWRYVVKTSVSAGADLAGLFGRAGALAPTALTYMLVEQLDNHDGTFQKAVWTAGAGDLASGQSLLTVDGIVYATPVALVVRHTSTTVLQADITDVRVQARLQPGIRVDQTNIYPLFVSDFDHLSPAKYVYTGTSVAAASGSGATYSAFAGSYAAQFTIPVQNDDATIVRRVSLTAANAGTGADLHVEFRTDAGGAPSASAVSGWSFVVPKEWLTTTPRPISIYVNAAGFTSGTPYWLIVNQGGDGTNHTTLAVGTVPVATAKVSTDGTTWTPAAPLDFAVWNSNLGEIVHVDVAATDIYLFEYSANGQSVSAIGEYYYTLGAGGQRITQRARYYGVTYDAQSGTVTGIG